MTPAVTSCPRCKGRGALKLTQCPKAYVGSDVWDCVDLSTFVDKGAWPVAGGTLDQTDAFLTFRAIWQNALDRLKAEANG